MISDDPRTWLGDKPPYTAEAKIAAEVNVKRVNGASNAKANGHAEPFSLISEGNVADVFAAQHANALRYCHDTGAWYAWDGTRWKRERTKLAYRWAHQLAKRLAIETKNAKTAITAGKAAFAAGVERIAQSDRAFAVTNDLWDQDPWLLATPGGTVDLRTGELRDPRQTDFITRRASVTPATNEDCPVWLEFLRQATRDDQDVVAYLRRWFGYCLTGITREHALLFIHGHGGNGKGTAVGTVQAILANYAITAAMGTFMASRSERHTTELAMLNGPRLVVTSEVDEGQAWAEAKLKNLTGGDVITARFMRQDNFSFMPKFKITIFGNHKPHLNSGVDAAMRRRLNMVLLQFFS